MNVLRIAVNFSILANMKFKIIKKFVVIVWLLPLFCTMVLHEHFFSPAMAQLAVGSSTATTPTEPPAPSNDENKIIEKNTKDNFENNTEYTFKPASYAVEPGNWGVGAGLSISDLTSPSVLREDVSPGPGFHLWGRYQFNQFVGTQFGLNHYDYSKSSFGITSLRGSLLFQTGWPDGLYPFVAFGASLNNTSPSESYGKDYTQFGLHAGAGLHIPWSKYPKTYWIPQLEWFEVFKKNSQADSINGLSISLSIAFFFDREDFNKNVELIKPATSNNESINSNNE